MKVKNKPICGWGINDVDYEVYSIDKTTKKIVWVCPYYYKWKSIIERIKSDKYLVKNPTYYSAHICEEWKYLSNFIKWVDSQPNRDWENCEPDKDLLSETVRIHSPQTVVFISKHLNSFLREKKQGKYLVGVNKRKSSSKYEAACTHPFKYKVRYIGYFDSELEAHKAWQAKKHEYACMFADLQDDPRVAEALRKRYAPDTDWTK